AARLIPESILVRRNHLESVWSRRQIAVKRLATSAGVLPIPIAAVESITKSDALRIGEAQSRVRDFNVATVWRGPNGIRLWHLSVSLTVDVELLDVDDRRKYAERCTLWIKNKQSFKRKEPQSPVGVFCNGRAEQTVGPTKRDAVRSVERVDGHSRLLRR